MAVSGRDGSDSMPWPVRAAFVNKALPRTVLTTARYTFNASARNQTGNIAAMSASLTLVLCVLCLFHPPAVNPSRRAHTHSTVSGAASGRRIAAVRRRSVGMRIS